MGPASKKRLVEDCQAEAEEILQAGGRSTAESWKSFCQLWQYNISDLSEKLDDFEDDDFLNPLWSRRPNDRSNRAATRQNTCGSIASSCQKWLEARARASASVCVCVCLFVIQPS